jgi:hypothetical protein
MTGRREDLCDPVTHDAVADDYDEDLLFVGHSLLLIDAGVHGARASHSKFLQYNR